MSGFPAQRKPTLRPGPGSLCTPRPPPLGIRCPWATAPGPPSPAPAARAPRGGSGATSEAGGKAPARSGLRTSPASPAALPHPSQARLRPQSVVVSLQIGFLEPCPRECVCVGCLYSPGVCRGRWFQFHAENVSSPPPSRCFSSFLPFALPPFLPCSLPPAWGGSWKAHSCILIFSQTVLPHLVALSVQVCRAPEALLPAAWGQSLWGQGWGQILPSQSTDLGARPGPHHHLLCRFYT